MSDPTGPGFEGTRSAIRRDATISPCGRYRYDLIRDFGDPTNRTRVLFVMLNPSTADALIDDPTIRRCLGFAQSWGYGGLVVVNLFAFRATDPRDLIGVPDRVGPDNDVTIARHLTACDDVVCAWGAAKFPSRIRAVLAMIAAAGKTATAIRLTKEKHPAHPLYLPSSLRPVAFS